MPNYKNDHKYLQKLIFYLLKIMFLILVFYKIKKRPNYKVQLDKHWVKSDLKNKDYTHYKHLELLVQTTQLGIEI